MKKNKIIWLLLLSIVGFGVGYYILKIYDCGYSIFCYNIIFKVGDPLFYGVGALAVVFFILIFIPRAVPAWKKFAIWFIPLATLLFILYPEPGSGDLFSPYPEQVFQWVSGIYILVSLFIISKSSMKNSN